LQSNKGKKPKSQFFPRINSKLVVESTDAVPYVEVSQQDSKKSRLLGDIFDSVFMMEPGMVQNCTFILFYPEEPPSTPSF